jgi:hypothetical protein
VQTRFAASLPEIERDSDKDGLTDLVEQRFMTNPMNPDSDGDGKKDGEDMNPLASGKIKLKERQEIWKAAYEQYPDIFGDEYHHSWPEDTFILAIFDSEVDFFELPDRKQPVIPVTKKSFDIFTREIGWEVPRIGFGPVAQRAKADGARRVDFEMDILRDSRTGAAYQLTLELQDGKWKLLDIIEEKRTY